LEETYARTILQRQVKHLSLEDMLTIVGTFARIRERCRRGREPKGRRNLSEDAPPERLAMVARCALTAIFLAARSLGHRRAALSPMTIPRLVPWACFLALATACSAATTEAPPLRTATPRSMTPTSPGARTPLRRPRPVVKLRAACPLLPVAEFKTLIGGDISTTTVIATEKHPTAHSHLCVYTGPGDISLGSILVMGTVSGFTPRMTIDRLIKAQGEGKRKMREMTGVGEAAVFFTYEKVGVARLNASKRSHRQTRTVSFTTNATVPERTFIDLVKLVLSRI